MDAPNKTTSRVRLTEADILSEDRNRDSDLLTESFEYIQSCTQSLKQQIEEAQDNAETKYTELTSAVDVTNRTALERADRIRKEYEKYKKLGAKMNRQLTKTLKNLTELFEDLLEERTKYHSLVDKFKQTEALGGSVGAMHRTMTSINVRKNKINKYLIDYNLDLLFLNRAVENSNKNMIMMDADMLKKEFRPTIETNDAIENALARFVDQDIQRLLSHTLTPITELRSINPENESIDLDCSQSPSSSLSRLDTLTPTSASRPREGTDETIDLDCSSLPSSSRSALGSHSRSSPKSGGVTKAKYRILLP